MKFSMILAITLSLAATVSFASKKKAADVYSATEEGPSEEVISSAPGYRGQNTEPVDATNIVRSTVLASPRSPTTTPVVTRVFDAVPASQAEALVRRLRLTEELISRYGRAYDYRTLTVMELQTILAQLDSQATQATELRRRMSTRTVVRSEFRKPIETTPAESIPVTAPINDESNTSIGSEAPESAVPFTAPSEIQ